MAIERLLTELRDEQHTIVLITNTIDKISNNRAEMLHIAFLILVFSRNQTKKPDL